ncbi:MAG TPA: efflux RND transporter permease subunit [Steroidobacteraceae bacterium]|nr:efflux RND transporter permease subunit [Steroidobacteraceae bacterium]
MNLVTWSIHRPVPVMVLFVAMTLAGIVGFKKLGVQDRPDMDIPTVTVTVNYPGVPPSQLETEVTRKIEDSVASATGIDHIRSTVTEGVSQTTIEFELERDVNEAVDDVRDAVTRIRSDLPAEIEEPIISRVTTAGSPVVTYGVFSPSMSEAELSWFVDLTISRELSSVDGVGAIRRVGGVDREIRVDLDPNALNALGTTAGDISRQLRRTQVELPGGEARIGDQEQSVRTVATASSVQDLAALPIVLPDMRTVRLDALAEVKDQAAEQRQLALLDGKPLVGFEVTRAVGASALGVAEGVEQVVQKLRKRYPNIAIQEVSNTVDYVRESYKDSIDMLLEGAFLAIVVVWIFLKDWRATIISSVALPLSVLPTFWVLHYVAGYTLNVMTMLALSLVVGILVDDAIVEVENIVRHLRNGKTPIKAAEEAVQEIGLAVVATSATLCAVFLPVAFMPGIPGKFFKQFALTTVTAVLASLLVARLLTPMMAAYMMKAHDEPDRDGRLKQWYLRTVRRCLEHRRVTLGVATAIFILSLGLIPFLSTGLVPAGNYGFSVIQIELPPGSTLAETHATAEEVRRRLTQFPDVTRVYTTIGAPSSQGFGTSAGTVRKATLTVQLQPRGKQKRTQAEFERAASKALETIPGARLSFGFGGFGEKLQISLAGDDPALLERVAQAVERDVRDAGLANVTSSASLVQPEIVITPIPERAAELGVPTEALSAATRIATSGDVSMNLPKFNLPERQVPIRVRLNDAARGDIESIRSMLVPGRAGLVPLENIASVKFGAGPTSIERYDRARNVTISADLGGAPLGDMLKKIEKMPALAHLPDGVERRETGDVQRMKELFGGFIAAMAIGLLCIYAVLVLLFHDFIQPLTILGALPQSVGGALAGLLLLGYGLSLPSLIGLLMLMGIVTKNSILLVEYVVMARTERGLSRMDALIDACAKRARPIVMTTIAMIAGMLPVAAGFSADPSFRAPMGIAVIGGLITSTALSLFVVPTVYTLLDDFRLWMGRKLRRERTEPQPAAVEPAGS